MKILKNGSYFLVVLSSIFLQILFVNLANAISLIYVYRGNNFVELEGEPGIFSTNDRVIAYFTIDCAAAHSEGNCTNLPYLDYLELGAVELEPHSFSAGPASLPTSDGRVNIAQFLFATDSKARIVDWDMDLFLPDPSGGINVDTDNNLDSAAALGGGAVVVGNPGEWRIVPWPPNLTEVLKCIEALESQVDDLIEQTMNLQENLENHRHIYRTGRGWWHNKKKVKTGPARFPTGP